uniref:Uncharacterized protein n=1 Tax=Timema bartmani TaxID=61472 RepID=A0A7R9F0Q4_9NEOP|nr:unnamed protein product [Timema bartmani]
MCGKIGTVVYRMMVAIIGLQEVIKVLCVVAVVHLLITMILKYMSE